MYANATHRPQPANVHFAEKNACFVKLPSDRGTRGRRRQAGAMAGDAVLIAQLRYHY